MHWQRVDDRVVREMTVDIDSLMRELAQRRPVFHSEADFQFALSRQIEVELLRPPVGRVQVQDGVAAELTSGSHMRK